MLKTILVPLDGSSSAEAVLPVALRIVRNTGGTLVLVQVVSFFSEYWPALTTAHPSLAQAVVDADVAQATTYLEKVAAAPEMEGIPVKTAALFGQPVPTILSVALSYNCDLIVLCSHRSAGMIHWMVGTVAEKIARHATMPVLIVRDETLYLEEKQSGLAQPLRLLVPLDGSLGATEALEPGVELLMAMAAPGQKTALHLARVYKQPAGEYGVQKQYRQDENALAQARGSLQQTVYQIHEGTLAPIIAAHHLPVTCSLRVDTDIVSALLRIAEQGDDIEGAGTFGGCDLIAISSHGRSGFQRWTLGSITERLLHATRRPIVIVHPPQPAEWNEALVAGENSSLKPLMHS